MDDENIVTQSVRSEEWSKLREILKEKQERAKAIRKLEEAEREIINSSNQIRRMNDD